MATKGLNSDWKPAAINILRLPSVGFPFQVVSRWITPLDSCHKVSKYNFTILVQPLLFRPALLAEDLIEI